MIREDKNIRSEELERKATALAGMDTNNKQAKNLQQMLQAEETKCVCNYLRTL